MKNEQSDNILYIPAKNVRRIGNCIIQRWISMLLTGICAATEGTAGAVGGWKRGPTKGNH